jgi:U3 small nucleolar RNA-associated protein 5
MFPSSESVIILRTAIDQSIMVQIADDDADEDEAPPPIIYEDKDTDDESEPDNMETDGESEELGAINDDSEHSDASEILMY